MYDANYSLIRNVNLYPQALITPTLLKVPDAIHNIVFQGNVAYVVIYGDAFSV